METLKCLSKDSIKLLHKNRLLRPLIRAEVISHTLKDVDISAEIREKTINNYIKSLQLKDEVNLEFIGLNYKDNIIHLANMQQKLHQK